MTDTRQPGIPLIFGEVLYDCFLPDGPEVLGGAPFNVAWHLQGFGVQPVLISAIGRDSQGDAVLERMRAWGMAVEGIQRRDDYPTGRVQIEMRGKDHRFDILPDQAYDHIRPEPALALLADLQPALLYCGSLGRREPESAATLERLMSGGLPLFVDINLRDPWWRKAEVMALIEKASWLKLNDEEFTTLTGASATDEQARLFREQHHCDWLVVTRGAAGASLVTARQCLAAATPPVTRLVDTVGAGDAFSAVVLLGILQGWGAEQILPRALEFAARICEQRGATAQDPQLYAGLRRAWSL